MRPIYLDNNATTRTDPAVVAAMLPFFSDQFGNASSSHAFGNEVAGAVKQARKSLQALLGAAFDHDIIRLRPDAPRFRSGMLLRGQFAGASRPVVHVSASRHYASPRRFGLPEILAGDVGQVEIELKGGEPIQRGGEVIDRIVGNRARAMTTFIVDFPAQIHDLLLG